MASHLNDDQLRALYARATEARRDPSRASCPSPDALLALVRGEGREQARLEVLDHAMTCPDCRRDFELLRAIEAGRRADAGAAVQHIRWRRPIGVTLVAALAAALVFVAVLGPWQRWRRGSESDVLRGDSAEVVAIAPAADASGSGPFTFTWHPVPGARRYLLEVLTPEGAVRASRETADTTATLAATELGAGDYRWWVRAQLDGGERRSAARRLRVGR
ncbi:MAG TPA: hypothetical protein VHM30_19040 [Gemmatimonadaceae bacterium]|nr:hypothetical protein [Gemmatimonadaceae bacterium]